MNKSNQRRRDKTVQSFLEESRLPYENYHHAWRIDDCVDLYKKLTTVCDLTEKKFYRFTNTLEAIDFAISLAQDINYSWERKL